MISHSIGDQSRSFSTRSSISRIKSHLNILLKEESSKQTADIGKRLQGNLRVLNSIEARMAAINQYQQNALEVTRLLEQKQTALSVSQKKVSDLVVPFSNQALGNSSQIVQLRADDASMALHTVVEQMNTEIAGQSLFSGLATDRPPLIPADEIVAKLVEIAQDKTTAEDVSRVVTDWFDAENGQGGFLDIAYKGTFEAGEKRLVNVSETRVTDIASTAADPVIRNMLKGLAMASILEKGILIDSAEEQGKLLRMSAGVLSESSDSLITEMANIGLQQEQLKISSAENSSELATLNIAHNDIVSVDWEETVTELNETTFQLQTMFAITARLSRLSLTEFLR